MSGGDTILPISETLEHHPDFELENEDGGESSAAPPSGGMHSKAPPAKVTAKPEKQA